LNIQFDDCMVPADAAVKCDNCDWRGVFSEIRQEIADAEERIQIGSEVPAGSCPACDGLCYLVTPDSLPNGATPSA
jgi:hypothetical protein